MHVKVHVCMCPTVIGHVCYSARVLECMCPAVQCVTQHVCSSACECVSKSKKKKECFSNVDFLAAAAPGVSEEGPRNSLCFDPLQAAGSQPVHSPLPPARRRGAVLPAGFPCPSAGFTISHGAVGLASRELCVCLCMCVYRSCSLGKRVEGRMV